jgi:hypothetical protein
VRILVNYGSGLTNILLSEGNKLFNNFRIFRLRVTQLAKLALSQIPSHRFFVPAFQNIAAMASLDLAVLDKATETDTQLWSSMMNHWITVKVSNPSSLPAVESWLTESIAKREHSVLSRMTMLPVLLTCTEENLDFLCAQHGLSASSYKTPY